MTVGVDTQCPVGITKPREARLAAPGSFESSLIFLTGEPYGFRSFRLSRHALPNPVTQFDIIL